jgi:hypothetical protein
MTKGKSAMDVLIAKRDALPFFRERKRGESALWWNVQPSGDYWKDRRTGQSYAAAVMPLMAHIFGPPALTSIFGDMFKIVASRRRKKGLGRDKLSGIVVGFLAGLGDLIIAGLGATMAAADRRLIRTPKRHRVTALGVKAAINLHSLLAQNYWRVQHEKDDACRAELARGRTKSQSFRAKAA